MTDKELLLQVSQATAGLLADFADLSRNFSEQGNALLNLMDVLGAVVLTLSELNPDFRNTCNRHLEQNRTKLGTPSGSPSQLDELLERLQKQYDSVIERKKGGGKPN